MDDDDEEEFPNLPPLNRLMRGQGKPPFWFHLDSQDLPASAKLCNKVFKLSAQAEVLRIRPDNHKDKKERSNCDYAHKWKQLRHSIYHRNGKLPHDAPEYLKVFQAVDWGSGHGESPRFEIPFEETYPTKATKAVHMMVCEPEKFEKVTSQFIKQGKLSQKDLPNESWGAVSANLCYHFSLKDEKCPHWQNCLFLHVSASRLREQFKLYRCMCGPNDGICKYGKACMYAHKQKELTVPPEFEDPAYPDSTNSRTLSCTNRETGLEVSFAIEERYIANTSRKSDSRMCTQTHDWCNKKDCPHGVHITSEGWAWLLAKGCKGAPQSPPAYFQEKVSKLLRTRHKIVKKASLETAPNAWGQSQVPASTLGAQDLQAPQAPQAPPDPPDPQGQVPPEPLLAISRRWKRQARPTHATAAEKPTPPYADAIFAYEAGWLWWGGRPENQKVGASPAADWQSRFQFAILILQCNRLVSVRVVHTHHEVSKIKHTAARLAPSPNYQTGGVVCT